MLGSIIGAGTDWLKVDAVAVVAAVLSGATVGCKLFTIIGAGVVAVIVANGSNELPTLDGKLIGNIPLPSNEIPTILLSLGFDEGSWPIIMKDIGGPIWFGRY